MEPTRRPEDETQLNKTPEEQVKAPEPQETAYSLEEIMNEFGGWTKREPPQEQSAAKAPEKPEKPEKPPARHTFPPPQNFYT